MLLQMIAIDALTFAIQATSSLNGVGVQVRRRSLVCGLMFEEWIAT